MCENIIQKPFGQGKAISNQLKFFIYNRYLKLKECDSIRSQNDIICELTDEFSISFNSIYKIIKSDINSFSTENNKKRIRKNKFNFDKNDFEIIDEIICDFNKRNINPYIIDVYKAVKNDPQTDLTFKNCCEPTFRKILKRMNYKYTNTKQLLRQELINTTRIQKKIIKYLEEKIRLEKENPESEVFFTDETFLDINDVKNKTLQPIDINKRLKQNKGINKRTRFSIIHCGSINGFVTDGQLVLMDKEINAEIYEHYLRQTLLPKLPPKSIVVLDNSGPHSRTIQ